VVPTLPEAAEVLKLNFYWFKKGFRKALEKS
jgi:hypothetical protein